MNLRRACLMALLGSALSPGQTTSFETRLQVNKTGGARGAIRLEAQGLNGRNVTLSQLLAFAWDRQPPQIVGPEWITSEGFDVTIKAVKSTATSSTDFPAMLQTLLTHKFRLKVHEEERETRMYWLTVAEGGAKLRNPQEEAAFEAAYAGKSPFKPGFEAIFTNKDLPGFARRLALGLGTPVIDKTGIKGRYWFQIEWPQNGEPGIALASLRAALREQAGLNLEERMGSVRFLIVDSAHKPSD